MLVTSMIGQINDSGFHWKFLHRSKVCSWSVPGFANFSCGSRAGAFVADVRPRGLGRFFVLEKGKTMQDFFQEF